MPDELDAQRSRSATDAPLVCGCTDAPPGASAANTEPQEIAERSEPAPAAPAAQDVEASASSAADELKLIVSIRDGRSTIGVQRPSSDPHVESTDELDLTDLLGKIPAVIERAEARWQEAPQHPTYLRPAQPARRNGRGGRRGQAAADGSETAAGQQQTLQLF